jgi:signal transduction histidine kinase
MRWAERSLARRVGAAAALSALAAAALTLFVVIVVTDQRVLMLVRQDLLARADALAEELQVEGTFDPARHADISSEIDEFDHGGIAIAVDLDGTLIAGSGELALATDDGCASVASSEVKWMVCRVSTSSGYSVRVGRPWEQVVAHRPAVLIAGLFAAIVVVLGGVTAGLFVGRWALSPLTRLRLALAGRERIEPELKLPRSGLIEIDTLAGTLDDLFSRLSVEVERSRLFASDAAHELRTPLTKLRAELELMAEEATPHSAQHARIGALVGRTAGLSELVARLLVLASSGESLRSETLCSLAAAVDAVLDETAGADRVSVRFDDDGMVLIDAALLGILLRNSIENALKFSDGPVQVSVGAEGSEVVLRVDDSGPGIPEDVRERVFEPFYRSAENRTAPGHGIGLALIAHIVLAHGGTAGFVHGSAGAHLEIRLPRHRTDRVT